VGVRASWPTRAKQKLILNSGLGLDESYILNASDDSIGNSGLDWKEAVPPVRFGALEWP